MRRNGNLEAIVYDAERRLQDLVGNLPQEDAWKAIGRVTADGKYIRVAEQITERYCLIEPEDDPEMVHPPMDLIKRFLIRYFVNSHLRCVGMKRDSGAPEIIHPVRMNRLVKTVCEGKKISFLNPAAMYGHDLGEHAKVQLRSTDNPEEIANALLIPLDMLHYIHNFNYKHRDYFRRGIYTITRMIADLTKKRGETYPAFINNILYGAKNFEEFSLNSFFISITPERGITVKEKNIDLVNKELNKLGGRKLDSYLLHHFVDSIILKYCKMYSSNLHFRKLNRREMIVKVSDAYDGIRDIASMHKMTYPLANKVHRLYKGWLIAYWVMDKYDRQDTDQYKKIKPLIDHLVGSLYEQSSLLLKDFGVEMGKPALREMATRVDSYLDTPHAFRLTEEDADSSVFAGAYKRRIRMLDDKVERESANQPQLLSDLLILNRHISLYQKKPFKITNLSIWNFRD